MIRWWIFQEFLPLPRLILLRPPTHAHTISSSHIPFLFPSQQTRLHCIHNFANILSSPHPCVNTFWLVHFPAKWLIPKTTWIITPQTSAFFEMNCFERKIYETVSYFFLLSCNLWTIEHVRWQVFNLFTSRLQFYMQVQAIFSTAVGKLDLTCMQEKYVYPLCNYRTQELRAINCMQ